MMRLVIDTTSKNVLIALVKDTKGLSMFNEKIEKDLSTIFVDKIYSMLNENSIKINDIDEIYVATGPGSFTGIRIGLTFSKVVSTSLNIKLIPISSLELLATTDLDADNIVSVIDARRDNVFAGIYDKDLNVIFKDSFISKENLEKEVKKFKNIKYISNDNFEDIEVEKPNIDVIKCIEKHKNDDKLNPHSVNPNYLKLTEAEENLKKNDKNC